MKEKGIEDAVRAVEEANRRLGKDIFNLDIYGQIDSNQTEWFEQLKNAFPDCIKYKGIAKPEESVGTIKSYFALLFPTYYEGEGFAGTLIDAFSAGVPIIASDWRYNSEIVDESVGTVYPTRDNEAFVEVLVKVATNRNLILCKKNKCLEKAKEFSPERALALIAEELEK